MMVTFRGKESSMPKASFPRGQSSAFLRDKLTVDTRHRGPGDATRQAAALRTEGVTVTTGHLGELTVDFGTYGWFPHILPSEAAEAEGSEEEQSG